MRDWPAIRWGWIVFGVALAVRLAAVAAAAGDPQRLLTEDSKSFNVTALNLLHNGVFTMHDIGNRTREPDGPAYHTAGGIRRIVGTKGPFLYEVFRTPFYPAYLAGIYGIFGFAPTVAVFIQCWVGSLTCVLAYLIGLNVGILRSARWGGLFLALEPGSVLSCGQIMSETWFTCLVVASLYFIVRYVHDRKPHQVVLAAVLVGLSVLCRPIGMYLPFVIGASLLLGPGLSWKGRIFSAASFLVIAHLTQLPWLYRNYSHFGVWKVSSVEGITFFYYKLADLESNSLGDEVHNNVARARLDEEVLPGLNDPPRNELEMSRFFQGVALGKIQTHIVRYLKLHLLGTVKLFVSHDIDSVYGALGIPHEPTGLFSALIDGDRASGRGTVQSPSQLVYFGLAVMNSGTLLVIYLFAAAALWQNRGGPGVWIVLVLTLTALYFCLTPGSQGCSRFRIPAMPSICILAAIGMERVRSFREIRRASAGRQSEWGGPLDLHPVRA